MFTFKNRYYFILNKLERRLDYILYKSYFVLNLKQSKQLIKHGHIKINNYSIKNSSYYVSQGDFISISYKYHSLIKYNLNRTNYHEIVVPKSLQINYKTLQIYFINSDTINLEFSFIFYVNSLIRKYY